MELTINQKTRKISSAPKTPLLWVLRDEFKLTAMKFGCGKGLCGACTVHMDGVAIRSCSMPASVAAGKNITTMEGLNEDPLLEELYHQWRTFNVPQCGYCQPGQIMSAYAMLKSSPNPTDEEIMDYMSGNICRCGTYTRILSAIKATRDRIKSQGA